MGKMDFIPLNTPGSSKKRNRSRDRRNKLKAASDANSKPISQQISSTPRSSVNHRYVSCDPKLVPRIREYMQTCDRSKGIKLDAVVNHLQQSYQEYKRKKGGPFKKAVEDGIDRVQGKNVNNKEPEVEDLCSSSDDSIIASDFSIDNDSYVIYEDTNSANNTLRDMYAKKRTTTPNIEESMNKVSSEVEKEEKAPKKDTQDKNNAEAKMKETNPKKVNPAKKTKVKSREILPQQSSVTFEAIGGIEECIEEVCKLLVHLKHPEVYSQLGITPPRGLLLHGPPGCGKTLLANAIAGELALPFFKIAATELVSGVSGESEEKIRELFDTAVASAPCVLFLDEVDSITPKRDTVQREMERRIVSQLLTCMDDLNSKDMSVQVLVIGATNRPDALDPALRRAGRFDREISLGIPNTNSRMRILKVLCRNLRLAPTVDLLELANETPGYVGADLMSLTREAAMCAVDRVFKTLENDVILTRSDKQTVPAAENKESQLSTKDHYLSWLRDQPPLTEEQMKDLFVEMIDFKAALKIVQPSAKREGFATIPDVTWADIGALREVREELQLSIMAPIRHRDKFDSLGLTSPAGILLCGPPGCGKTLLAKAIANESGVNFISVKGPELLNMYLGESERAVRQCFQRAQNSSPCVIFFDELDALCPRRSDVAENGASSRVVNQLLTEMDGINGRKDVFILGATNRPDILDPAVLRPGRLDKILFVNLPLPEERVDILNTITKLGTKPCLGPDVLLKDIGLDRRCNGFTGADLSALVREASVVALKQYVTNGCTDEPIVVRQIHFEKAFERVRLSVTPKDQRRYEAMRLTYSNVFPNVSNQKSAIPMDIVEQSSMDGMDFLDNGN